ncbi:GNAT family N-acetyltransferase [Spirochaeta isovalerica]|uniref:GNAT superfamily N-acetyltransferase n=1 Tax=Spirochaeta isovalerica TaxID=150 RepID=A0A841RAJ6_9SPIO|nr:GNAT family N-acetyltransferase [Spirochaeta isovalerica]MBB6480040.1 GNAT superfamily N-acetyltransferase [Spirochaeta isovalerica]
MSDPLDTNQIPLKYVDGDNIAEEHICCAIGNDKVNRSRAEQKKEWMKGRFKEGHRFLKADVRGKVFIEYSPAEISLFPVEADGFAVIQCFWVSGRYKGHGLGRKLYDQFEEDCRNAGYKGIAAVVGKTKKPFMVDKKVLIHFGFEILDRAEPWYELAVKKFDSAAPDPVFFESARRGGLSEAEGLDFFYSPACPFNYDFTQIMAAIGEESGFPVRIHLLDDRSKLTELPTPWGLFSVFLDGELLSAEVMTGPKFRALLESRK